MNPLKLSIAIILSVTISIVAVVIVQQERLAREIDKLATRSRYEHTRRIR